MAVLEPATPFVPGWHIDAIIEHLEALTRGQLRNLVINVPPRHMKCLLVSVFWPAWEWIRWPARRWLFSSYGAQLSIRDSVKCRRLIESPWYQATLGRPFCAHRRPESEVRFENNRSGYRLSTSVGGAATGEGGDRMVCDDPHNVQEAESDAVRKCTIEWWDTVMCTRVNDPKTAAKVIVMQRCHQQDLSGHLLEQGGWEHLCCPRSTKAPRRATSIGWRDPRRRHSELLWPERFGPPGDRVAEAQPRQLRGGGPAAAAPLASRGRDLLKRHWFGTGSRAGGNLPPVDRSACPTARSNRSLPIEVHVRSTN